MFIESLEGRRLYAGTAKFIAHLLGADETPVHATPARGFVKFKLSKDGTTLSYRLGARKIDHVSGAHIHLAPPGVAGPIVVDLVEPAGVRTGRHKFNVRGTITAAEFTGPMAGLTMADLVAQMTAGATYVNVHTDDGAPPPDTGPGDFPGGEIRGQIRRLGKVRSSAPSTAPNPVLGY